MPSSKLMKVLLACCLVTGAISLLAVITTFSKLPNEPALGIYCVAGVGFGDDRPVARGRGILKP